MTEIEKRLKELEDGMAKPDFWQNKDRAQEVLKEINFLREKQKGKNKYDKGDAVLTIFSGAGGDDAEDWVRMLFEMYIKFCQRKKWTTKVLHEHKSESGGYKNITLEINGENAYGMLRNESGVHRLVRVSPFSAKKLRHTSFALVETVPKFVEPKEVEIPESDVRIEMARSSGPGGQNVNKRETAVRIIHLPTNISVHVDSERAQMQNRERAMQLLKAKLYKMEASRREEERESMRVSTQVDNEWGYQIRSYVLHPYKMVKDHRTEEETSNVEAVLNGEIDNFIEAERKL